MGLRLTFPRLGWGGRSLGPWWSGEEAAASRPVGPAECGLSSGLGSGAGRAPSRGGAECGCAAGRWVGILARSTDGLRAGAGRGDGWPASSPGNRARRRVCASPRELGSDGGPSLRAQPPEGRGSGRAESFSGWGGSWLFPPIPSLVSSQPLRLWSLVPGGP